MKKIVILMILLAFSLSVLSCGGGAGSSSSPHGENPGIPTIVRLLPSHYIALTNSIITLHARVLDGNGAPVKNVSVIFTNQSPIGTLSATTAKTNLSGIATVTIKSTQTGFATIQAEVNKGVSNVRDKKTVFFSSTLSLIPYIVLDVDGNNNGIYNEPSDYNLFEGGNADDNEVTVRATVYNKFGQRSSGSAVVFDADTTEATFPSGSTKTTDSAGEAFVFVKVTPMSVRNLQTVLNITAKADIDGDGFADAAGLVSLYLQPVTVTSIDVTANPSIIAPSTQDKPSTSTITATVKMLNTLPVPDDSTVSFVASCGTITPFAQTTDGVATATFTAPAAVPSGPCRVTASIAGLSGFADITVTSALSVLPTTQSINGLTGGTVSYIISGGIAPYTVTSGNRNAACNSTDSDCTDAEDSGTWIVDTTDASGNYSFTVTVPAGTATQNVALTVRDAAASSVNATLGISGTALSVQPGSITKDGTTAGDVIFTIFGGVPPYDVFPNNANPIFAPQPSSHVAGSGGTFTVSVPASTPAATIIYTVRDTAASTTTATLNITAGTTQSLIILPGSVSVIGAAPADTVEFTVSGGTAPYVITSTDPSSACNSSDDDCLDAGDSGIWNVAVNGGTFTVTVPANAATENVTLNVFDSTGATKSATLSIVAGGAVTGIVVSPASVSVTGIANPADGNTSDDVTFTIAGGTAPYAMYSANTAIIASQGVLAGSTFTIDPDAVASSTGVTLTVIDSLGVSKTVTVTVTPPSSSISMNPSTIAVSEGTNNIVFNILGGLANFTVYSSNTSVLTLNGPNPGGPNVISSHSFTANAVGQGNATITVIDSDGKSTTATVTVTNITLPDTTAPTVDFTIPVNGATNVPINGDISIRFSEAMDATTISTATITLFDDSASASYVSTCSTPISYTSGTFTATLNINCGVSNYLVNGDDYTVTVSTNVRDLAGNTLAAPYTFSFTAVP